MHVQAAAETRIGRRTSNQDSFCVAPDLGLYVVADGMGGYAGGELASTLTVEAVERFVRRNAQDADLTWPRAARRELSCNENILQLACELAHGSVRAQRHGDQAQMGSTVAAMLIEHDTVVIGLLATAESIGCATRRSRC
jgi:serine/threonine protein phosphatase PrpC